MPPSQYGALGDKSLSADVQIEAIDEPDSDLSWIIVGLVAESESASDDIEPSLWPPPRERAR